MKLTKHYEIITNDGMRLYSIGKVAGKELFKKSREILGGERNFYVYIVSDWHENNGTDSSYEHFITPEKFEKYNAHCEEVKEMTVAELEAELGHKIKIIK